MLRALSLPFRFFLLSGFQRGTLSLGPLLAVRKRGLRIVDCGYREAYRVSFGDTALFPCVCQ